MKPRFVSRFDMLPIRWRLAVTSAILTFVILLTFGLVIAFVTERQMENDFNDEVRDNATRIQQRLQEQVETTVSGGARIDPRDELLEFASADDVAIRVLDANGDLAVKTVDAPDLGPPRGGLQNVGDYRVPSTTRRSPTCSTRSRAARSQPRSTACACSSRWACSAAARSPYWPASRSRGARWSRSPA